MHLAANGIETECKNQAQSDHEQASSKRVVPSELSHGCLELEYSAFVLDDYFLNGHPNDDTTPGACEFSCRVGRPRDTTPCRRWRAHKEKGQRARAEDGESR